MSFLVEYLVRLNSGDMFTRRFYYKPGGVFRLPGLRVLRVRYLVNRLIDLIMADRPFDELRDAGCPERIIKGYEVAGITVLINGVYYRSVKPDLDTFDGFQDFMEKINAFAGDKKINSNGRHNHNKST